MTCIFCQGLQIQEVSTYLVAGRVKTWSKKRACPKCGTSVEKEIPSYPSGGGVTSVQPPISNVPTNIVSIAPGADEQGNVGGPAGIEDGP